MESSFQPGAAADEAHGCRGRPEAADLRAYSGGQVRRGVHAPCGVPKSGSKCPASHLRDRQEGEDAAPSLFTTTTVSGSSCARAVTARPRRAGRPGRPMSSTVGRPEAAATPERAGHDPVDAIDPAVGQHPQRHPPPGANASTSRMGMLLDDEEARPGRQRGHHLARHARARSDAGCSGERMPRARCAPPLGVEEVLGPARPGRGTGPRESASHARTARPRSPARPGAPGRTARPRR